MSKDILIIPDAHSRPGNSNKRFEWLGKLQLDLKPDIVICGGDWWDIESLYNVKSANSFKLKQYRKDIAVGLDAQEKREHYIKKRKQKRPEEYFLIGNHEERIDRVSELLGDTIDISLKDLKLDDFKWKTIPFLKPLVIEDIAFCHYFQSGNSASPIAGDTHAQALLNKKHMSACAFHSHRFAYANSVRADGKKIFGLVAGCYLDFRMKYAQQSNDNWWSGVIELKNVDGGFGDIRCHSLRAIQKEYE